MLRHQGVAHGVVLDSPDCGALVLTLGLKVYLAHEVGVAQVAFHSFCFYRTTRTRKRGFLRHEGLSTN